MPTPRSSFFLVLAQASMWIPLGGGGFESLWIRISATKPSHKCKQRVHLGAVTRAAEEGRFDSEQAVPQDGSDKKHAACF